MITSVMSSLEFVGTTGEGPRNLQRLWNSSLAVLTQPVATTIEVTYTAGTVAFDVLVRISVASERVWTLSTDPKRAPRFVVDIVPDYTLPDIIQLVMRKWNAPLLWSSPHKSMPYSDQSMSSQCSAAEKNLCRSSRKTTGQSSKAEGTSWNSD